MRVPNSEEGQLGPQLEGKTPPARASLEPWKLVSAVILRLFLNNVFLLQV